MGGKNLSAAVSGSYLYVASIGLNVFDLRVANPQTIAPWLFGFPSRVVESIAYCAGGNGLQLVDVSDPRTPALLGFLETGGYADEVAVSGNYAYVFDRDLPGHPGSGGGLLVVDIHNPRSPVVVGAIAEPHDWRNVRDIAVLGSTVYVSESELGLRIIDVSDPAAPRIVGTLAPSGSLRGLAAAGEFVYLAGYTREELQVIDVSDPANPQLAGTYATGAPAYDVALQDNYAVVAAGRAGLIILDVRDPTNPRHVATFEASRQVLGVSISGDYAFVGNDPGGLQVLNIADKHHPRLVGRNSTDPQMVNVYALNDSICIASGRVLEMFPFFNSISATEGKIDISWESFGKARLQRTTSLTQPDWQDLIGSENTNRVTLPLWSGSEFFRLVRP